MFYFCKKEKKITTDSIIFYHGIWKNTILRLNFCLVTFKVYDHR